MATKLRRMNSGDDGDLRRRFPDSFGYLASVRKQALRVVLGDDEGGDDEIAVGASKLGGAPDLPRSVRWPEGDEKPLGFVLQVRLEELAELDVDALLPHEGMLYVFVAHDGTSGRLLHVTEGLANAERTTSPDDVRVLDARSLTLAPVPSFPRPPTPFVDVDALKKAERPRYAELLADLDREAKGPRHQLLGYVGAGDEGELQDGDTRLVVQLEGAALGLDEPAIFAFFAQDANLRRGSFGGRFARF